MRKVIVFLLALWCLTLTAHEYRLWYDKPAMTWTQALPVGNGIIGGMVFGTPAAEHIQLNEETIWAGQPNQVLHPEAKTYLPQVRQLIFEGKYKEAEKPRRGAKQKRGSRSTERYSRTAERNC